jgi:hypothetical protein
MARVIRVAVVGYVVCLGVLAPLSSARRADVAVPDPSANLRLTLRDQHTGALVPGRITLEQRPVGAASVYHFVTPLTPGGTAVPYDVSRSPTSFEKHTTVSADPFGAQVPPGLYVVHYEHGPEWQSNTAQVWVRDGEITERELPIWRWIDMNARGWYSGDTHVHRSLEDLPNVMRAEDLNVALPLSYWVRDAYTPPLQGDKTVPVLARLITVEPARVIWPMNTEYELFTVNGRRHTLGAVFVLNHQQPLRLPAPPVAPIAGEAERQGALLDLDKHSWPWSLMLVPVMDVDLFELSNNHIWRTEFFFREWTREYRPDGWNIETDAPLLPLTSDVTGPAEPPEGDRPRPAQAAAAAGGFTEWGWIDFGFKTYYALLNCGFRLRPSAGTASGVHPVPLGFGRVYVECPDGFSFENWMRGLDQGRSFVTTGPMLFVQVDGQPPGSILNRDRPASIRVQGRIESRHPLTRVEIVCNGRVVDVLTGKGEYESPRIWRTAFDVQVPIDSTSWIAVRGFEGNPGEAGSLRFAHSSPVHIEMPGRPLRPRKVETDYLVRRMQDELTRNRDVLRPDELAEYELALMAYQQIAETARDDDATSDEQLQQLLIPLGELPPGWQFLNIAETDFSVLGTNPRIFSRPDMVHLFPAAADGDVLADLDVLRAMWAVYQFPSHGGGVLLSAWVCASAASAERTLQYLKAPDRLPEPFRLWQQGDLVVLLMPYEQPVEADLSLFESLVTTRLAELRARP